MRRNPLTSIALLTLLGIAALAGTRAAADGHESAGPGQGSFAIRAKRIHTVDPKLGTIEGGTLLVVDGKIAAVGTSVDIPAGIPVHDEPDAVIIPGLVAASSGVAGPMSRSRRQPTVDARPLAIDAFDPYRDYKEILVEGITTTYLDPGTSRLVAGQGAVVKLHGGTVLSPSSHLDVHVGAAGQRPPAKQDIPVPSSGDVPIEPAERQRPSVRISQFVELAKQFESARAYAKARASNDRPAYDPVLDSLAAALSQPLPARVDARRAADILQFLRHRDLFPGGAVLTGATEAHRVADSIAAAGVPVVVEIPFRFDAPGPDRGIRPDLIEETLRTAAALEAVGVRVALVPSAASRSGDLRMAAMAAVRGGMSETSALAAVTLEAARILGVDDRVGSLAPGKDADFLLLGGEPLRTTSHVRKVYVNGHEALATPDHHAGALVVRAGTILTGESVIHSGAVLVEDGKIVSVGRTVPTPRGARVVDAGPDAVVTPGFIDSHGHLGLEADRSPAASKTSLSQILAYEGENFREVAAAGVTTVMLAPYAASASGSQILAMKTAGKSRDELVVSDPAAFLFSMRGKDPLTTVDSLRAAMKKGQAYVAKWKKYEDDLAKWKVEQEKKKKEAANKKKTEAPKEEKKEEKKEENDEGAEPEPKKVDPLSGTWKFTLSGGPIPQPTEGTMKIKLEGSNVTGSIVSPIGGDSALTGTFSNNQLEAEVDVETPFGPPMLTATLDREDHLAGSFAIGDVFSLDFDGTRTEKEVPEIKITRKKKKSNDGRPQPPPVDPSLEPIRMLLAGEIAAVVDAQTAGQIDAALQVFRNEFKVPLVLLGAEESSRLAKEIAKAEAGVVVPRGILGREDKKTVVPADRLSRHGIRVGFQSGAEDAARTLPLQAAYAVYHGLDADTALRALTVDAAKMYRIDDRVGSLAAGRDGDLLIFSGPPFEASSRLLHSFVAGKEVTHR